MANDFGSRSPYWRINVPTCFDNPVLVHTVPIKGPFLFLLLLYNNIIILVVSMKLQFTTSCWALALFCWGWPNLLVDFLAIKFVVFLASPLLKRRLAHLSSVVFIIETRRIFRVWVERKKQIWHLVDLRKSHCNFSEIFSLIKCSRDPFRKNCSP